MTSIHDSVRTISVLRDEWKSIRKKRTLLSGYIITCFKKQSVAEILICTKSLHALRSRQCFSLILFHFDHDERVTFPNGQLYAKSISVKPRACFGDKLQLCIVVHLLTSQLYYNLWHKTTLLRKYICIYSSYNYCMLPYLIQAHPTMLLASVQCN